MRYGQHPECFLTSLLAALALGILCGAAADDRILSPHAWSVLLGAVFFLAALSAWQRKAAAWPLFFLLFLLLGICRLQQVLILPPDDVSHQQGQVISVEGELCQEPRWTRDENGWRVCYTLEAEKIKAAGGCWQTASGGLLVYGRSGQKTAGGQIGDRVRAAGEIRRIQGYQNPGQIDSALLAREAGIHASLLAGKNKVEIFPQQGHLLLRLAAKVRYHYREQMECVMPKTDAAAVFAMLFGGYDGLDPQLVEDFTVTGLIHILSVSGSHISLVAAAVAGLGILLRLPSVLSAVLVIAAIFFYSLLAGFVPPVVRSALMGSLAFLAVAFGREREAGRILLVTGIGMLLWSPLLLFHISFELSFLATAGLLYLAPHYHRWLTARGMPRAVSLGISITLAAQLATLPVLAWYFQRISLVSLLANLVVTPLIDFLILGGLAAGAAAFIFPLLGRMAFAFCSLLLGGIAQLTHFLAGLPASVVIVPAMGIFYILFFYVILLLPLLPPDGRQNVRLFMKKTGGRGLLLLLGFCLLAGIWQGRHEPELAIHFIDTGQGDAALAVTPGGRAILFDTGGSRTSQFDIGERVTLPYLRHYGVRRLEAIFLTHAHEDHAQGGGSILHRMPVGAVYTAAEGRSAYARSMGLGDNDPVLSLFHEAKQGQKFQVDGLEIEVLYAPDAAGPQADGNEASNVYRLQYGKASVMITGDLTSSGEASLLSSGRQLQSTILKVAHHGSATSSTAAFLEAAAPLYGVICVGRHNRFGHPHPEVVSRLAARGTRILRTDLDGAVVFHTDGQKMRVETFAGSRLFFRKSSL